MTIDERLDRLTERHEALTQTVELIAAAQIKNDERMAELTETMTRLAWRFVCSASRSSSHSAVRPLFA